MTIIFARKRGKWLPVLVDFEDGERIGALKLSIASHGYAQICPPGTGRSVPLHRWLMSCVKGDGKIVDHINGDGLDCRRSNMRIVDPSGSSQNVSGRGASSFRNVYPTRNGRWRASVKFQGVMHYIGIFDSEEEAAELAAAKRMELMPSSVRR